MNAIEGSGCGLSGSTWLSQVARHVGEDGPESPRSHGTLSADTLLLPGNEAEPVVPERPQTPQTTPTSNNAKQADLGQFFSQKKSRPEPQQPKPDYPHPSPYVDGYHAPSMVDHATVTSLETMLGWPKHYRTALQQKMPPHFLQFLKNRVENSSYSTCFSGVDAPGSVAGAGNGCSFVLTGGCK